MAEKINPRERARWMAGLGIRSGSAAAVTLGQALREWRTGEGLTQLQAAKRVKVSDSIWATWETGRGLPGEQSWRLLARFFGPDMSKSIMTAVELTAREPGGGEPGAVKAKAKAPKREPGVTKGGRMVAEVRMPVEDEYPFQAGWGEKAEPVAEVNRVRGADTDGVIGAVLACGLSDQQKALLCAAVIAMAAGVGVEVEIRAAV